MNQQLWHFFRSALLVVLVVMSAACTKQVPPGERIVIGIDSEPERLDPLTIKSPKTFIVSWQLFEGLLDLDDAGRIAPAIAEAWESQDNVTWRFRIRKGVSFHSSALFGSPAKARALTAADVVASYTAFCSGAAYPAFLLTDSIKGCAEFNSGKAQTVEGLRVLDDNTVEIRLVKPEPFFLNRLTTAWIAIFPQEAMDPRFKDQWGLTSVVGTGPYRLVSRTDTEIVLERNDEYWNKNALPTIARLVFRVIKNEQIRLAELSKGGVDLMELPTGLFASVLDSAGAIKADYTKNFSLKQFSTFNSHMLGFNVSKVADVHLRRAMFYGVDRKSIVDKLLYGYADVTGGTVPPGIGGFVSAIPVDSLFNPELAREELRKSTYKGEPIELLVHEQGNSEQIGQFFQDQMKTLGVNIQLTKLDFNSVIGRMVKGEAAMFSMFFDYVLSSPQPILINLFSSAKRPVPNFWQFSDQAVDAALESLRNEPQEGGVKKSAEIEAQIMTQAPAIFLYRQRQVVIHSKRYGELPINPHGLFRFNLLKPLPG